MCLLAICMLHLQYPVWFSVGLSFHFPVRFFFFFCGYKFFKDNLQFFLLVLFEAYFVFECVSFVCFETGS